MVDQFKSDAEFIAQVATELRGGEAPTFLLSADEDADVEFKSTARWNLREATRDKLMETPSSRRWPPS